LDAIQSTLAQVLLLLAGLSLVLLVVILLLIEASYILRLISRLFDRWREPDLGKPHVATASGTGRWSEIINTGGLSLLVKRPKRSGTKAESSDSTSNPPAVDE
jgi:Na+-transporting methylmalonyl-CoA/oxaloacetate decarboxylase gamma subunit